MLNLRNISALFVSLTFFVGCAGTHYSSGARYLKQQKYKMAIDSFTQALEKKPKYPKALTLLGIAYYKSEMYEKASSNLKMAKKLNNKDKKARLFLGMTYLKENKTHEAIKEWDSYLEMFPSDKVSSSLKKNKAVIKKGEVSPETVDLMTNTIETIFNLEEEIRENAYYHYVDRDYGRWHGFFHLHGRFRCD